jgi:hypothetical protein
MVPQVRLPLSFAIRRNLAQVQAPLHAPMQEMVGWLGFK